MEPNDSSQDTTPERSEVLKGIVAVGKALALAGALVALGAGFGLLPHGVRSAGLVMFGIGLAFEYLVPKYWNQG